MKLSEAIEKAGDAPADDPVSRLAHVLHVYEHEADEYEVITATRNVYAEKGGVNHWTGLTMGDLRALAAALQQMEGPDA